MRRLLYFLKDYRKESVLGPLFKLLEASFELLVPLVVADIIDVGIAAGDSAYVLGRGGILILLGLIGLASSITAQYFAAKAAVGCSTQMRGALFRHLNSFSYKDLDAVGTSTLITRLTSDINQVQRMKCWRMGRLKQNRKRARERTGAPEQLRRGRADFPSILRENPAA